MASTDRETSQITLHIETDLLEMIDDLEKSLPADVPLHKRGFGVMDEPEGFA